MMSSSDLPACPACGAREVRAVQKYEHGATGEVLATFYACAHCGRDRTDAWKEVQPPKPVAEGFEEEAQERHAEEDLEDPVESPHNLGIAATHSEGGET